MSAKRLHIHSLPLVGLALFGTAAVVLTTLVLRGEPLAVALVRPAVGWSYTSQPNAARSNLALNTPDYPVVELPGVSSDAQSVSPTSLFPIGESAESIALYLAVEQAAKATQQKTGP